jgi:ribonuclease HIII
MSTLPKSYVCTLIPLQADKLRRLMDERGWAFEPMAPPHAQWKAVKEKTGVVLYNSGKLTVQGKGTAEFVQFLLEPEILGEAKFGYEAELKVEANPEMLTAHAGIDESGKGDYFGPLVVASVFVDGTTAPALIKAGVTDSKLIKSDKKIYALAEIIRNTTRGNFAVVAMGPEAYNRLHTKFGNVNRLLAWGHARTLENLLEKVPDCPRAISDQFGAKELVQRALLEKGRKLKLEQMHRAEADVAVAAASILARAEFIFRMDRLGEMAGVALPRGASAAVVAAAVQVAKKNGFEGLARVAKLHFKTTDTVLSRAGIANPMPWRGSAESDGGPNSF